MLFSLVGLIVDYVSRMTAKKSRKYDEVLSEYCSSCFSLCIYLLLLLFLFIRLSI